MMDTFSRYKWGWGVFAFWIVYWSYLISLDADDSTGFAHILAFIFPWVVAGAVYVAKEIVEKRATKAFWDGYDAGRRAEQQELAYYDLPDNLQELG